MSWPARTWIAGELANAQMANAAWRDTLTDLRAGAIAISGQLTNDFVYAATSTQTGRVAAEAGKVPFFTGTTWRMILPIEAHYPVGIVYRSVVSTNPAIVFGFGTWQAFGSGRVRVSFDTGDSDFNTAEKTGGAKAITLSESHLPIHTHIQDPHNHTQNEHGHTAASIANTSGSGITSIPPPRSSVADNSGTKTTSNETAENNPATATNQATGGGGDHNNLMPYIVEYAWKRVA